MLCIFCLEEKPERTGAGEHPIPLAVGGSWTIQRLCEDCDSRFGSTHDARLTEVTRIAERREALGLVGNSGRVPNALNAALSRPVAVADSPHHRMVVRPRADGTYDTQTIPSVEFVITPNLEQDGHFVRIRPETFVIGMMPRDQACDILRRRLERAFEEYNITYPADVICTAAERLFDEVEVFERPITVNVTRRIVTGGYAMSLLKTAYEAAWHWLGDDWLDDPEAERIRQHLGGDESVSIHGVIREGRLRQPCVAPTSQEDAHVIYMGHSDGVLYVEVQLFDLFTVGVRVTTTPERYQLPPFSAIIMDPVAGTYRELPSQALFESRQA